MRENMACNNTGHVFQNLSVVQMSSLKRIWNHIYTASYFLCVDRNGEYCLYRWQIKSELVLVFTGVVIIMKTASASAVTHANMIIIGAHSGQW